MPYVVSDFFNNNVFEPPHEIITSQNDLLEVTFVRSSQPMNFVGVIDSININVTKPGMCILFIITLEDKDLFIYQFCDRSVSLEQKKTKILNVHVKPQVKTAI